VANGGVIAPVDIVYNDFSIYDILEDLAAGVGVDFEERDLVETNHTRANVHTLQIDGSRSLGWMSGEITFQTNNINARLTLADDIRASMPDGEVLVNY
jgi:hypothetical protein